MNNAQDCSGQNIVQIHLIIAYCSLGVVVCDNAQMRSMKMHNLDEDNSLLDEGSGRYLPEHVRFLVIMKPEKITHLRCAN